MNNETRTIKIFGWGGIVFGIFSILVIMGAISLLVAKHTGFYDPRMTYQQLYYLFLMGTCGALLLIGGVQLLRLKESGRKIYLFVAYADIAITIYRYVGALFTSTVSSKLDLLSGMIVQLIFSIFLLYLFTRPKMKEQFK